MNFLAHSLLGHGDPATVAGQFAGDFVRGSAVLAQFPVGIRRGIVLHRKADIFTDAHPNVVQARRLFHAPYRRLAGIIVDVLFDHFLARQWSRFSHLSLGAHAEAVHAALHTNWQHLPPNLQRFSAYLVRIELLVGYVTTDGVQSSYERLASRSAAFAPLASALPVAMQHEVELEALFQSFYPELDAHVRLQELTFDQAG